MSQPLFKVGERVGLVSISQPECNGEYVVERVLEVNEEYTSRNDNVTLRGCENSYAYLLNTAFLNTRLGYGEVCWAESALRKLHKPSKYSFEQLLSEIKQCNMNTIGD